MNEVLSAIKERFSTRGYTEEKLTREEISALVEAGLQSPTAANRQEVFFTVVNGDHPILAEIEQVKWEKIAATKETQEEKDAVLHQPVNSYYNAPTVLFLSCPKDFSWGPLDAGIATQSIALAAEALGLGSIIVGSVKDALTGPKEEYFAKALHFPEGYRYAVAIGVGHKAAVKAPHTYDETKNAAWL